MNAVALFGVYPSLPSELRFAGRQPFFGGGHCVYVAPLGGYVPPFLDEFTGELSKVADCVPASAVRGVNFQTHGAKAPCTAAEREALQNAMGTQDTGADELDATNGILKRYGIVVQHGQSWAAISSAIGGEAVPVRVGDPLGTKDYIGLTLGQLKPYATGLSFRYVAFSDAALPSTGTEEQPMWANEVTPADESVVLVVGTRVFSDLGQSEVFRVAKVSSIHAVLQTAGFWGYVLGTGGVRFVAKGTLTHAPYADAAKKAAYDAGFTAARTEAVTAVQAIKP